MGREGVPFLYHTKPCAQGGFGAGGAIEPQFYALLRERCGIADDPAFDAQMDRDAWPLLKLRLAEVFRTRTRDDCCHLLEGCDACFAPVLDWDEAPEHPHNQARHTFCELDGVLQPAPAPRFTRTPPGAPVSSATATPDEVLARWGHTVVAAA
jgi:alpha-methylacyl-CoA racemase